MCSEPSVLPPLSHSKLRVIELCRMSAPICSLCKVLSKLYKAYATASAPDVRLKSYTSAPPIDTYLPTTGSFSARRPAKSFEMSSRRPPTALRSSSSQYTQVRTEDEDEDKTIPIVRQTKRSSPLLLWLAVAVLSLLLAGNAWQQGGLFNSHSTMGSYEKGFKTELGASCEVFTQPT